MKYYGRTYGNNRAEVVRCGAIVDRLKAINDLQQRTGNKELFQAQRSKLMNELSEVRKGL